MKDALPQQQLPQIGHSLYFACLPLYALNLGLLLPTVSQHFLSIGLHITYPLHMRARSPSPYAQGIKIMAHGASEHRYHDNADTLLPLYSGAMFPHRNSNHCSLSAALTIGGGKHTYYTAREGQDGRLDGWGKH